jgi:predicted nucleic acid-binding protein
MRFWDASAILPLFLEEPESKSMRLLMQDDDDIVAWWGTTVECYSAFARLRRERLMSIEQEDQLRSILGALSASWIEIQPSNDLRHVAGQLLLRHPLRAADSVQLAAAMLWADMAPREHQFVCLDSRLHLAARGEGFAVFPSLIESKV